MYLQYVYVIWLLQKHQHIQPNSQHFRGCLILTLTNQCISNIIMQPMVVKTIDISHSALWRSVAFYKSVLKCSLTYFDSSSMVDGLHVVG